MRIACPNCAAAYEVPDRLLASGPRALRCARCGQTWTPSESVPPQAAPAPEDRPAPPPPSPPPDMVEPEPEPELPPPSPLVRPAPPPPPGAEAEDMPDESHRPRPPPLTGRPRSGPTLIDPPLPRLGDEPPHSGRSRIWIILAWAVSLLLLAAAIAAVFAFRDEIAAAWPPAARLYPALGLPV